MTLDAIATAIGSAVAGDGRVDQVALNRAINQALNEHITRHDVCAAQLALTDTFLKRVKAADDAWNATRTGDTGKLATVLAEEQRLLGLETAWQTTLWRFAGQAGPPDKQCFAVDAAPPVKK
jgi:hypothetical protein